MRKLTSKAVMLLAVPGSDSLYLPECSLLDEDTLIRAIEKCTNRNGGGEDEGEGEAEGNQKSFLHVLSLGNCGHSFGDKEAGALVNHASQIEVLDLQGCYKLNDPALSRLLLSCAQSLTSLDLKFDSRLGLAGLKTISTLQFLRSLNVDQCVKVNDEMLIGMLVQEEGAPPLLPRLEKLSIAGLTLISDDAVESVLKALGRQLRQLSLANCIRLGDASLVSIRRYCKSLKDLDLANLRLSTTGLLGLFVSEGSTKATRSLVSAQHSIGSMERVSLQGVVSATDDVMLHLAETCCASLAHLDISGCHQLTSKAAVCLHKNCAYTLQTLDVSFCRNVEQEALEVLVSSSPRLISLTVWGCTQLSRNFYVALASSKREDLAVLGRL